MGLLGIDVLNLCDNHYMMQECVTVWYICYMMQECKSMCLLPTMAKIALDCAGYKKT